MIVITFNTTNIVFVLLNVCCCCCCLSLPSFFTKKVHLNVLLKGLSQDDDDDKDDENDTEKTKKTRKEDFIVNI